MPSDHVPFRRVAQPGTVYLVGAGPGAADLITLRGWHLLQTADVIVYDSLADPSLHAGLAAERIDAGKRSGNHGLSQGDTTALLIRLAQEGRAVVRLKGGDPFVLGRGSEEALALAAAGVPCEVVPGVSSSLAAPLLAGIPLTHRGVADAFCVVSAHPRDTVKSATDPSGMASIPPWQPRCTLVVLMGVATLAEWLPLLAERNYPQDLPIAFVTWAARPEQTVLETTLGDALDAAKRQGLRAPAVAVIGPVVRLRHAMPPHLPALSDLPEGSPP